MDVRGGSIPLNDASPGIAKGDRTGAEPAVLPVNAANTVLGFIGLTGWHATPPLRQAAFLVIRMQIVQPPKSNGGTWGSARIFIKSAADVVPRTIRPPAENCIGGRLYDCVEFLVL